MTTLSELIASVRNKIAFASLQGYIDFACAYLSFIENGLQAEIVSQNETQYRFLQYRDDGHYNISRPLNNSLLYRAPDADILRNDFRAVLQTCREQNPNVASRSIITRSIYTLQQTIGAALDALPAGKSNEALKLNGDLFEQLIRLTIRAVGVTCEAGTVQEPVVLDSEVSFHMSY